MSLGSAHDRPREKLESHGVSAMGDNELLAILLGHGTAGATALDLANRVLASAGSIHGLTRLHRHELTAVAGIGPAQSSRIQAAIEIGRRTLVTDVRPRPQFLTVSDLAKYLLPQFGAYPVERFGVLLLDTRHRLIKTRIIALGSLDAVSAHPREVFREAVLAGAAAVVAFHNHPSGDPSPSADDIALTRRLVEAGDIVGVDFLDHMILADTHYCSLLRSRRTE